MRWPCPRVQATALVGVILLLSNIAAAHGEDAEEGKNFLPPPVSYNIGGGGPCVSRHARPSNSCADDGYIVGGGAAFHGEPGYADEGTWGWDYFGFTIPRRIALGWWHGDRYQGGIGAYKTDGPRLHP